MREEDLQMRGLTTPFVVTMIVVAVGCGGPDQPGQTGAELPQPTPIILDPPFTSEQIRDAWVEGLELKIRRQTDGMEVLERWRVIAADADGATIESVVIDAAGTAVSEPRAQTSSWDELRDHAAFPADRVRREAVNRETALGAFDGRLYTVTDPESGTVSEYFFADAFPGAPLVMRVVKDGEVVAQFEQIERGRFGEADGG